MALLCAICKENMANTTHSEIGMMEIDGTEYAGNAEAQLVHIECIKKAALKGRFGFSREDGLIYMRTK